VSAPTRNHAPMTEARKRAFLDVLRQTGSFRRAATLASPHLGDDDRPDRKGRGAETFRDQMRRDPTFAAAVQEAIDAYIGDLENLLQERLRTPNRRPIFDKNGNQIGVEENMRDANLLLLRALERMDERWAPRKQISGQISHDHQHTHELAAAEPGFNVTARDLALLSPADQRALLDLFDKVEDARRETADARVVATVPARPALPPAQP